ncbi:MAG: DnaJ domain-containing protein, partial [Candidatus Competibacteraceae bacterium]
EHDHMDRAEAYRVLGLQSGAGRDEIQAAYRRLIQRVHPDQGGSSDLAARINLARDVLLRR